MGTKTIGLTGRDYSTLAAYASYLNGLGTFTEDHVGECYNDTGAAIPDTSEVSIASSGGYKVTLRAASGHSFRDHANKLTNALRYDPSLGVAFTNSVGAYGSQMYNFAGAELDGLQFTQTATGYTGNLVRVANPGTSLEATNCIFYLQSTRNGTWGLFLVESGCDNILIQSNSGGLRADGPEGTKKKVTVYGNSSVRTGVSNNFTSLGVFTNISVFGFTTDYLGTVSASSSNNATDKGSFGGTNWGGSGLTSTTSAAWVSTTLATLDMRLSADSTLRDAGASVGTSADIIGTTRPQGSRYDIGCWEARLPPIPDMRIKRNVAVPRTYRSQPQTMVRIAGENRITRGLVLAVLPQFPVNIVSGEALTLDDYARDVGPSGNVIGAGRYKLPPPANASAREAQFDLSTLSAFVLAHQTATQSANYVFARGSGAGTNSWGLGLTSGVSNGAVAYCGGSSILAAGTSVNTLVPTAAMLTASAGDGMKLYVNGRVQGTQTYGTPTYNYNTDPAFNYHVSVGPKHYFTGAAQNIRPSVALLWNRALTAAEVKSICDNPWQVFADLRDRTLGLTPKRQVFTPALSRMLGTSTGTVPTVAAHTRVRKPWCSQPQSAAAALRPDLKPLSGFNPAVGLVDLQGHPFTVGAGVTRLVNQYGIEADFKNPTASLRRTVAIPQYPLTFVAIARHDATGEIEYLGALATAADKTNRIYLHQGSAGAQHIGGTTFATALSPSFLSYGKTGVVVAVFKSQNELTLYYSGNTGRGKVTTTTDVGAPTTLTKLAYGAYDGSVLVNHLDGGLNVAAWFQTAFDEQLANAVLDNPWQLFAPRRSLIWVPYER